MPVNWKAPDAYERLFAAVIAASDMKLDYRKIATFYGRGATYDAIEGRFRGFKRLAGSLRDEIDSGARPAAPARGTNGSATSTPRKSDGSKSATTSPNGSAGTSPPSAKSTASTNNNKTLGGRVTKNHGSAMTPSKKQAGSKQHHAFDGSDDLLDVVDANIGQDSAAGDNNSIVRPIKMEPHAFDMMTSPYGADSTFSPATYNYAMHTMGTNTLFGTGEVGL